MNIELHIEELVLHGFAPQDRYRISKAMQNELTRLVSEQGFAPKRQPGQDRAGLDGGSFNVRAGDKPETIGAHIAQAVHQGIMTGTPLKGMP